MKPRYKRGLGQRTFFVRIVICAAFAVCFQALLGGVFAVAFAQENKGLNTSLEDSTQTAKDTLDQIFRSYSTMGASVAVIENGQVIFTHTYGTGQKDGDAVTEDTLFQVGSISKMVAGIGLLRLVEDGQATLESDLGELLGFPVRNPQYPATPITLRQLMSHTAGFRDSGYYRSAVNGNPTPLSTLFSGKAQPYAFLKKCESGTMVSYSNFGGGLAGSLIEALSGQTIDQYMTEQVFEPLGITAAYQASLLPMDLPLADMYAMPSKRRTKELRADPTNILTPAPENDYFLTAGKLIISAPDLAKILILLCDGGIYENQRILEESTVKELCTPQNNRGSVACVSGNGLFLNIITNDQVEGRTMYGHGGKAYGMLCAAYFDPIDRTGVVMLTNGCNNRMVYNNVGKLGREVLSLCYTEILDPRYEENTWLVVE